MSTAHPIIAANQIINELAARLSFANYGWAELSTPISIHFYEQWLERGQHGDMAYLETHLPHKKNPQLHPLLENTFLNTSLCFAFPYKPHPRGKSPLPSLKVAAYVGGEDYHHWITQELQQIADRLKVQFPKNHFLVATDSRPVLERDLGARAQLGWVGKNTCLIDRKRGSFFLLGEILTDFSANSQKPPPEIHDFCGNCNRCIEACPTGALLGPRNLDARKCISYLTIESQEVPSPELRRQIGSWFFGCDICQDVCPWNLKLEKKLMETPQINTSHSSVTLAQEIKFILSTSGKKLTEKFKQSALSRARPFGLKRNALIIVANLQIKELAPEVLNLRQASEKLSQHNSDSHAKLRNLCDWTLQILRE